MPPGPPTVPWCHQADAGTAELAVYPARLTKFVRGLRVHYITSGNLLLRRQKIGIYEGVALTEDHPEKLNTAGWIGVHDDELTNVTREDFSSAMSENLAFGVGKAALDTENHLLKGDAEGLQNVMRFLTEQRDKKIWLSAGLVLFQDNDAYNAESFVRLDILRDRKHFQNILEKPKLDDEDTSLVHWVLVGWNLGILSDAFLDENLEGFHELVSYGKAKAMKKLIVDVSLQCARRGINEFGVARVGFSASDTRIPEEHIEANIPASLRDQYGANFGATDVGGGTKTMREKYWNRILRQSWSDAVKVAESSGSSSSNAAKPIPGTRTVWDTPMINAPVVQDFKNAYVATASNRIPVEPNPNLPTGKGGKDGNNRTPGKHGSGKHNRPSLRDLPDRPARRPITMGAANSVAMWDQYARNHPELLGRPSRAVTASTEESNLGSENGFFSPAEEEDVTAPNVEKKVVALPQPQMDPPLEPPAENPLDNLVFD